MSTAADTIRRWREHPDIFVRECLGVVPDAWQDDVLKAFVHNQRVAMKACKGPGKTCLLAWLIWNFLLTRPNPIVMVTSITADTLADTIWMELSKWQQKSELLKNSFNWTKTRISSKEFPETWFAAARPWSKNADAAQQADTLAGRHADYIMFVLDESGGIPDAVMAAAEAALSSCVEGHIVQAGNPTHLEGPLYRASTSERRLWHVTEITADPDDPKRTPRVSIQWAREQIEKYGRDNPYVLVNVFGQFPPSSLNALIGPDEVREAIKRYYRPQEYSHHAKIIGIDVAREGCFDDKTEILTNEGWKLFEHLKGSEQVLTLNGDCAQWGEIQEVHKYPFEGELNLYESSNVNFCITDNHKMLVRTSQKSKKYQLKEYKYLPESYMVRGWNQWKGETIGDREFATTITMPNGGTRSKTWKFSALDWATFMGWFLSEGCVYTEKRKNPRYRIIIAQKPGQKMEQIKELLNRMQIKWKEKDNKQLEFTSQCIGRHLLEVCNHGAPNKHIPTYIKNATTPEIETFLEAFCLGDGTRKKDNNGKSYMSSSYGMMNDIQEMLAKIGKAGSLTMRQVAGTTFTIEGRLAKRQYNTYVVYERSSKGRAKNSNHNQNRDRFYKKSSAIKIPYKGFVWCVSTPHKTIFVRRNGKPMWSGNSDSSVIFTRQGLQAFPPIQYRNIDGTQGAGIVARKWNEWEADACFIDDTGGFGSSWIDNLRRLGFNPIGVHFSEKSANPQYYNKRTEMLFNCVDWIKSGGALPDVPELTAALTQTTYTFKGDKLIIEPKEAIKAKLGYSPDFLDSLILSFSHPVLKMANNFSSKNSRHTYQYDSLAIDYVQKDLRGSNQ